jgi:hypothetical protein
MTARIGHNNTKGSIQIDLAYATPDGDLPVLNTVLTEDFIRWVPTLYSVFGGHWQAADHEGQSAISIMPPFHLSVEGRFAAINKKRKEAAESAAEKKAGKSGHKYTSGGAKFAPLYQPRFMLTADEGAHLIVPLMGLLKKDQKVRFACLREHVEFSPVVVTLRPRDVEDIVSKEDEVIAKKVDDPSGGGKKVPRIQGDLYNFRVTNQRISFCDIDSTVVGHYELPNRIGDEEFRKDYILTKKTLRTVLKELTTMMPNTPVQLEFSDTVLRISAKSGGTHGTVLLPAALTAYSGNTTAFWFEKTE